MRSLPELDGHFMDLMGVSVPTQSRDTRSTGYPTGTNR
jgi:hypothetical protein